MTYTTPNPDHIWPPRRPTYVDGTPVRVGDHIRYHQAPGGFLSPPTDGMGNVLWRKGVAAHLSECAPLSPKQRAEMVRVGLDPDEVVLCADDGVVYGIHGHVIERLHE